MNWAKHMMRSSPNREYRSDHFCYNKELSDTNKHHTYYDTIIRDNVFLYIKMRGYSYQLFSALIGDNITQYKRDKNFHLSTLVCICNVLNIKMSDLMEDNTRMLNPKILTNEPPEFVQKNAVRRECDEEWLKKKKEREEWYMTDPSLSDNNLESSDSIT